VVAVLVGGADVASRLSSALGDRALFMAFAPVAALENPDALLPAATSTESIAPARLKVPSLGINAPVEAVGKKADGSMGTPSAWGSVAWYKLGSKPGGAGNAVFAGHVNNALTTAGVFEHLGQISLGDKIEVEDSQGNTLVFQVTEITSYEANDAPLDTIFSTEGPSQVVLITCDGDWSDAEHQFERRLVVVAREAAL
jgi:LPXTG-site transpeptidase (sortase) family protein